MQSQRIGVYDAKIHLSRIIQQVAETGVGVTITVNGEEKVDIVPAKAPQVLIRREALLRLLEGPISPRLTDNSIKAAIEEGRS